MRNSGLVQLVGAGPGDPELLTLKALRAIEAADVVVFDRLVSPEILALAKPGARMIPVGKEPRHHPVPQEEINAILVREALSGNRVVRLKGGDPFIFGRGSEEALALGDAGVPCDVIPGITAAQGCSASSKVPLTHRGLATSVRYITGHCRQDEPLDFDWHSLADPEATLVVYMGAANIGEITLRLLDAGLSADTPVLVVNNGTTPRERRLVSNLRDVPLLTATAALEGPVLFIIGRVVHLYPHGDLAAAPEESPPQSAGEVRAHA